MQIYKAPDNSLHCPPLHLVHRLPPGSVPVSDAEAEQIRTAYATQPIDAQQLELIKQHVREARKPVFYTLAGMQSEALALGDSATATAITTIQQALRDLPELDVSACTTVDEVAQAFVAAWQAIALAAPANVVSAFNEVLAP